MEVGRRCGDEQRRFDLDEALVDLAGTGGVVVEVGAHRLGVTAAVAQDPVPRGQPAGGHPSPGGEHRVVGGDVQRFAFARVDAHGPALVGAASGGDEMADGHDLGVFSHAIGVCVELRGRVTPHVLAVVLVIGDELEDTLDTGRFLPGAVVNELSFPDPDVPDRGPVALAVH